MKKLPALKPQRLFHKTAGKTLSALVIASGVMAFSLPAGAHRAQKPERIEVAFVLDTTGSMGSLLKGAKKKIWAIANTIVDVNPNADIHMALVGYRDFGDSYVTKKFDMSSDIQGLYGNLVQFNAAGGGDTREAVNEALNVAVSKLKWSKKQSVRRIVFLVGDAPPHMDYNGPKYPTILETAADANIIVNTVQAGNSHTTRRTWKDIAQRGGGSYIPIPQDGGHVVVIETPYDGDIIILQKEIDDTVIPYGSLHKRSSLHDKMERKAAAPSSVQVENSRFYAKRKFVNEVVTGGGDLVGDLANGRVSMDKVKKTDLPKVLQRKSSAEREVYVKDKLQTRKKLQQKMGILIAKRDKFAADKSASESGKGKTDSFSRAVSRVLKKQLQ